MTLFQIVGFYTALHLLLLPVLMFRIGQIRMSKKISLGDGGNDALNVRIRTHGNFIETTPLALIGLFALAGLGAAPLALHIFGAGFFLGRVLHAHGMTKKNALGHGRTIGMLLTLLTFLGTAIYLLILAFNSSTI